MVTTSKEKTLRLLIRLFLRIINGTENDAKLFLFILQSTIKLLFGDQEFIKNVLIGHVLTGMQSV